MDLLKICDHQISTYREVRLLNADDYTWHLPTSPGFLNRSSQGGPSVLAGGFSLEGLMARAAHM
jgi:hypothetical protein